MTKNSRIYIAGHHGLIGSAVVTRLAEAGCANLIVRDHASLDLTDTLQVEAFFDMARPEYVILAAGKVGGIVENKTYLAEFIVRNLAIQLNVIRAAHTYGVKRLIFSAHPACIPENARNRWRKTLC